MLTRSICHPWPPRQGTLPHAPRSYVSFYCLQQAYGYQNMGQIDRFEAGGKETEEGGTDMNKYLS